MAKRKKAAEKATTTVATSNKKATTKAANSSPAPTSKKAGKTSPKKEVPKPALETRKVCFTDQDTGKRFCGEMTEVPKEKSTAKVSGTRRRKR